MNFKRLLVPTDLGEAADRALDLAAAIAGKFDGGVVLAHVFQFPITLFMADPYGMLAPPIDEILSGSHDGFDAVVARAKKTLPQLEAVWVEGDPRDKIVELARSQHVDAIVMGTHGRGALGRAAFGTVAERLVRTAPVPVLTTSAGARAFDRTEGFRHILVPTDFGDAAKEALEVGADLAKAFSARLSLLHAGETLPAVRGGASFAEGDPATVDARRELAAAEASARSRCDRVEAHLLRGDPRACIERFVSDARVDLVVMGTHRRTGLSRALLGSVAERIVRSSLAPVLTLGAKAG